jgi:hypothetical protein
MLDRINDIAWQAHQGSVAAIIQLLNDRLSPTEVRTRAIYSDAILHILCEAAIAEQLEQSFLVEEIQKILESIAPRNIRRVNINSRIVREEQLLWLQEIHSQQDNQLLWSQEITLTKPHILKQLIQDFTASQLESGKPSLPKFKPFQSILPVYSSKKQSVSRVVIIVISLGTGLLLGWFLYKLLGDNRNNLRLLASSQFMTTAINAKPITPHQYISTAVDDRFAAAVRIANQASASGKSAMTSTQWLELAANWQQAADLMAQVPLSNNRYQEAQIRSKLYKQYSQAAQKEADKSKSS